MTMRNFLVTLSVFLMATQLYAQTGTVAGRVYDASTGETLIGVNIIYIQGKGTVTDYDGNYNLELPNGNYTLTVSYVGYETISREISLKDNAIIENFELTTVTLTEVEVIGDIAKFRETPVAFSTVDPIQLQEELAAQDLPMILNSTPGVYATQQGGGDGDARINIRGFNQRNVAVMIDGIPVNDMENGWVYWSNWFGLDLVTQRVQVQRGLGVSKLAIPSVGGTMNVITAGIKQKRMIKLKQEVGNDGFLRTSLGITTGKLKGGWGITAAGSYKRGNGWVERTFTEGWFYYLKIDKQLGKHILSFSAMGAPQEHGQKRYKKPIATFDSAYARNAGVEEKPSEYFDTIYVDPVTMYNKGIRYNPEWGQYIKEDSTLVILNEKTNYYHKPQFSLRDFWNVNDRLYISNILYLSLGRGGGTSAKNSLKAFDYTEAGQINFQKFYDMNRQFSKSYQFIRSQNNNHVWVGLLSTFNYRINDEFVLSGGLDLRRYEGEHYEEIYDLLGGDYAEDHGDENRFAKAQLRVGDKINYHNLGIVQWAGLFGQLEYSHGNLNAFVNLTGAYTGYKKIDYFKSKVINIGDTTLEVGYSDTVYYQGEMYTRDSPGLEYLASDWYWKPGFTIKAGANYNLSERSNVFINLGYLSRAPRFNNVYDRYSVDLLLEIRNEFITAIELGYSYSSRMFAFNTNAYFTNWKNKPGRPVRIPLEDDKIGYGNIQGMDALHMGIELDVAYKILSNLDLQGMVSLGDWRWTSEDSVRIYDDNNQFVRNEYFNAKGVHVGDAAQTQLALSLRYEPIKKLYFTGRVTWFDRYFADFNPFDLDPKKYPDSFDENGNPLDSWKTPSYSLVDFHTGYSFNIKKVMLSLRLSVLNVINEKYVSDAMNNAPYSTVTKDHDAKSAGVFMGMGRRFNTSFTLTF